ncbi:FecR family protein [Chitinophaga pinensis]|uniref:Anti-FecI sigma factor, FecR n=1 Tax=Chitinophaga pinensis (strain ATCC 43595 / DSM 2588 / LMG 13176 / NBRC 15968 / NCIMB 11800 / UQM 2034) TaxID=485918 RepID=A0A979GRT1_CHIPD|nr:FecR family protein [Chitinophaga pinensis]ACU60918.1 anti-FecI sigma factor, FecR [Chitinophaga pinensis DSM 2588]
MGDINNSSDNQDQQANAWYDSTNDAQPFDAFGSSERQQQIGNEIYDRITSTISRKRQRTFLVLKIAAAVVAVIVNTVFIVHYFKKPAAQEDISWVSVSTRAGESSTIVLPDSSTVTLKANSRITYLSAFTTGDERNVKLEEGEAFFDVRKHALLPFTVHAKGLRIKVLGTSFNISAYSNQPDFKVEVMSGKIRVERDDASGTKVLAAEMTSDQCLTMNKNTANYKIETRTLATIPTRKTAHVTRSLTLQEIGQALGDRFNLFVQLNNPENDTSVYTVDLEHASLDEILRTLSAKTGFSYTVVNKQHLIIQPKTTDQ